MIRETYSEEFKANAVRMVLTEGLSRTEVGRRLETSSKNISRWVKDHQETQRNLEDNSESKPLLKKRILELEKANRQLQIEHDILKKAAAFFAKELL